MLLLSMSQYAQHIQKAPKFIKIISFKGSRGIHSAADTQILQKTMFPKTRSAENHDFHTPKDPVRGRSLPQREALHTGPDSTLATLLCLPYPTLPYPTLPYPTYLPTYLPYSTYTLLPYATQPYSTLAYHTLLYPTIPYHTLPCSALFYPTLPCPAIPYPTLPYPTLLCLFHFRR